MPTKTIKHLRDMATAYGEYPVGITCAWAADEIERLQSLTEAFVPHPRTLYGFYEGGHVDVVLQKVALACECHGVEMPEHVRAFVERQAKEQTQ